MKRGILIGVVAVVVIVVAVGYFVLSNLGALIKEAVEDVGPKVTQTRVTLDGADVDIAGGKGSLSGLEIGNPAGFETDYAFRLGSISLALDTGSIGGDTIVIKEIVVDAPAVTYEHDFGGPSNIEAIQKNVEAFAGPGGGEQGGGGQADGGPKLIIENLYVRGANVAISAKGFAGKTVSQTLPEIHLTDIGKDEGGASPAEVAQQVMAALTSRIEGFASGLDIGGLLDVDVGKALGGATEMIEKGAGEVTKQLEGAVGGEMTKGVGEAAGSAGDAVKEGVGEAGEKLKKLFK